MRQKNTFRTSFPSLLKTIALVGLTVVFSFGCRNVPIIENDADINSQTSCIELKNCELTSPNNVKVFLEEANNALFINVTWQKATYHLPTQTRIKYKLSTQTNYEAHMTDESTQAFTIQNVTVGETYQIELESMSMQEQKKSIVHEIIYLVAENNGNNNNNPDIFPKADIATVTVNTGKFIISQQWTENNLSNVDQITCETTTDIQGLSGWTSYKTVNVNGVSNFDATLNHCSWTQNVGLGKRHFRIKTHYNEPANFNTVGQTSALLGGAKVAKLHTPQGLSGEHNVAYPVGSPISIIEASWDSMVIHGYTNSQMHGFDICVAANTSVTSCTMPSEYQTIESITSTQYSVACINPDGNNYIRLRAKGTYASNQPELPINSSWTDPVLVVCADANVETPRADVSQVTVNNGAFFISQEWTQTDLSNVSQMTCESTSNPYGISGWTAYKTVSVNGGANFDASLNHCSWTQNVGVGKRHFRIKTHFYNGEPSLTGQSSTYLGGAKVAKLQMPVGLSGVHQTTSAAGYTVHYIQTSWNSMMSFGYASSQMTGYELCVSTSSSSTSCSMPGALIQSVEPVSTNESSLGCTTFTGTNHVRIRAVGTYEQSQPDLPLSSSWSDAIQVNCY